MLIINNALQVIHFLSSTGYIDLSKRRVSPEEIQKCEEKYSKAKTVRKYA